MDIIINNEKINFELGGSEDCENIINDLGKWLSEKKHIVLDLKINNENYDKNIHGNLKENAINKIEVNSEHIEILTLNSLSELQNYASRVDENIKKLIEQGPDNLNIEETQKLIKQLSEGYDWALKAISNIEKIINIDKNLKNSTGDVYKDLVDKFINYVDNIKNMDDIDSIEKLYDEIETNILKYNLTFQNIVALLYVEMKKNRTLLSLEELQENLNSYSENLKKFKNNIVDIAEKIQTGQESEGMEDLKDVFLTLENLTQFYGQVQSSIGLDFESIIVEEKSFQSHINEFLELMKELLEAFENQDYIMLSDLLEYELVEYFDIFEETFKIIQNYINNLSEMEQ